MKTCKPIFRSFFQAGFECSTHRTITGKRLDLVSATEHDLYAKRDYALLHSIGITTAREGLRWHLIELKPGEYNFDSLDVILEAADDAGVEVILDILHFGWPDYLNVFEPAFLDAFENLTMALISYLEKRNQAMPFLIPVNEASFLAWGGGDKGFLNPFAVGRGPELKAQLVRAALRSMYVIKRRMQGARLISAEPVIHIAGRDSDSGGDREAEQARLSQFEVWDMLSGRLAPELGGSPEFLDILGVNFYDRNQWVHLAAESLKRGDPEYRPFHQILQEIWERYRRPIFVSETGTEGDDRPHWFSYVCQEVLTAIQSGIPIYGICLYPILNHPGWDDDRHCCNGLFDYPDGNGARDVYAPLAEALLGQRMSGQFTAYARRPIHDNLYKRPDLLFPPEVGIRVPTSPAPDESFCS